MTSDLGSRMFLAQMDWWCLLHTMEGALITESSSTILKNWDSPIPPNWLFADSIPLLKLRRPGLTKYNLKSLCLGELGELPAGLHHAEADVAALWAVMKKAFGQADDDASTKSVANACLTQCYGEAFQTVEEDGFEEQDFEM